MINALSLNQYTHFLNSNPVLVLPGLTACPLSWLPMFQFINNRVRTTKANELIDRIINKIKDPKGNKKGQQSFYELLPCCVGDTGFEPVTPCL